MSRSRQNNSRRLRRDGADLAAVGASSATGGGDLVSLAVGRNLLGSDRTGTVTIAGQTFTVGQSGILKRGRPLQRARRPREAKDR